MRTSFSTNQIILQGNVTKDPEVKTTKNGTLIMSLGLATSHSVKNGEEYEEKTTFHNIKAIGKGAGWLEGKIKKGHKILVIGRQENRTYEKEDGTKGFVSEVIADTITPFLATNGSKNSNLTQDAEEALIDSDKVADDIPF